MLLIFFKNKWEPDKVYSYITSITLAFTNRIVRFWFFIPIHWIKQVNVGYISFSCILTDLVYISLLGFFADNFFDRFSISFKTRYLLVLGIKDKDFVI